MVDLKFILGTVLICVLAPIAAGDDVTLKPVPAPPGDPMPDNSFYEKPAIFSKRPDDTSKFMHSISRFGPVGIGIELHPPAFVMKVGGVEEGSPAAATGKIKKGQIIESINGETLKAIDPRIQLGKIIEKAEATDGIVELALKEDEDGQVFRVKVEIPVLGAYSETWPVNCPKSERIVRNLADYLAAKGWSGAINMDGSRLLFLLSTGDERDLEVATQWARKTISQHPGEIANLYPWFISWGGPALAEYYLRTGDEKILPVLKAIADSARTTMYHDGWGGRGMAGHHMGLAGTGTLTFLLLARQCGVDVDDGMLSAALRHYYRFAGRGTNPYMDARPEQTFTDNGRNAILAFAMNAAASLAPNGEESLYAKARDISAIKSFYSTSYMLHGHTGGGIGEVWRSAAMGLMQEKQPEHYRDFMDERKWFYEISRRFDGSFGIVDGDSYDVEQYGVAMGLTYTAPRKKLCIFGAPRSPYAKEYPIPARPWGSPADDAFYSLESSPNADGVQLSYENERLSTHCALHVHRALGKPDVSDELILDYVRHREYGYRQAAWEAIGKHNRYHLLPGLLKDPDPRVRQAGLAAIPEPRKSAGKLIPGLSEEQFTDEIQSIVISMINDPEESLWVVDHALIVAAMCPPEKLAPHVDRLIACLNHDEQWIRGSALNVLVGLAADEQLTGKILHAVADVTKQKMIRAGTLSPLRRLPELLAEADEKTIRQVVETLSELYRDYSAEAINPPGGLHPSTEAGMLDAIAGILAELPGGKAALYQAASKRYPNQALPHQNLFLSADPSSMSEELKEVVNTIVKETLIPRQMASTWNSLDAWFSGRVPSDGRSEYRLFSLYDQAGITEHNWHPVGPIRNEMEWYYTSFDATEKWMQEDDRMGRFREVTFPPEVKEWHAPDFDPAKAGWKKGKAPFGAADGKPYHHWLSDFEAGGGCKGESGFWHCGCGEPVNTLWEKEVLLLKGTFEFPEFEEGYCYRLLHGGISHVGNGGGFQVYVNGRLFIDNRAGVDRRGGNRPIGQDITKDWWPEFSGREVDLSVISFKKNHPRTEIFGGYITISMHRMKAPDLDPFIFQKAIIGMPFKSSGWQALQHPDTIQEEHEGKFVYDGKFVENKQVAGSWKALGAVDSLDGFTDNATRLNAKGRQKWEAITFNPDGTTDDIYKWYTGDLLLDINSMGMDNSQVLDMRVKTIDGTEYLFIEEGGFEETHGPDWKCRWIVFRRKETDN